MTRMPRALAVLLLAASAPAQVTYERIRDAAATPAEWLSYHGAYNAHRHSTLARINTANAATLRPAWIYQTRARHRFQATPIVADGVLYLSEPPSSVTAIDLHTRRPLWTYHRPIPENIAVCCGQVNRGVALLGDLVYIGTLDAHLVALDRRTGRVRWDVTVGDYRSAVTITPAPLIVRDKVIIGMAGAEYGVRGFLDAYDAATGRRAWRFWTVPGPGEPGNNTWSGDSWQRGGATTWVTGSYDPQANLVYWGTGNPGPDYIGDVRLGDNLYSDSVIALDASTGQLRWHFQFTPHDVNDMDSNQIPLLLDATFKGRPRKLMLFANRNAFYYILDRLTGEFLQATQFARQNWTLGLDPKGRPTPNPKAVPSLEGALVYPDDDGASNWFSPSYSPRTGLFYQNVRELGAIYFRTEAIFQPGQFYLGAGRRRIPGEEDGYGALRAWNALTGIRRWEFRLHTPPWAGILTTAGGLVFSSTMEGDFFALDDATGKLLWKFQAGGEVWSNPISYEFEGRQYIAIAAGSALIAFSLQGQ